MWIIKENKRLFLTLIIVLFLSFLWHKFFISPLNADAENKVIELNNKKDEFIAATKDGTADEEDVKNMEDVLSNSKNKLLALKKDLQLNIDNRFYLPKGEASPRVYFQQLLIKEKSAIDSEAVSKNVKLAKVDNLGFPADVDDKVVSEYLIRLSLISKVLKAAITSNIRSVTAINPVFSDDKTPIKEENFINTVEASIKVESSAESIVEFIHLLQKKGDFVLTKGFSFKIKDSTVDIVEADLVLSTLIINEDGKLEVSEGHKEETGDKGFNWQKLYGSGNK